MPPNAGGRAWIHRALAGILALACVWFAARGWSKAQAPDSGSDFPIYYAAGQAYLTGEDPGEVQGYLYLPAFAAFAAPFALLPYALASALWQALSLAAVLWASRRCAELATEPGAPIPPALRWIPLACSLRLVDSNLSYAQVNAFTFVLVLEAYVRLRRGRSLAAGLWAGAAIALKLLPAIVPAQLALLRRARAAAWSLVAALAFVALLPLASLGPGGSLRAHERWWDTVVEPYRRGGRALLESRDYLPGQSLTACGYRLLAAAPARSPAKGPAPERQGLALDPDQVRWILHAIAALHLLVWSATVWLRPARPGSPGACVEAALTLALVLWLAPLVHKAHMLWLMLAYAAFFGGALRTSPRPARLAIWSLVAISLVLIGGTTPFLVGRAMATGLLSHNAIGLGLQVSIAALVLARWFERPSRPSTGAPRDAG